MNILHLLAALLVAGGLAVIRPRGPWWQTAQCIAGLQALCGRRCAGYCETTSGKPCVRAGQPGAGQLVEPRWRLR